VPQDQAHPVPLHVAAAVINRQLTGLEAGSVVLDSTALAISHVADIYYVNAQGQMLKIPDEELAVGMFENGAKRFRTRSGNVYESLSMRRGDMAEAILILRKARGAMHAPDAPEAGKPKGPR
jgi:hypothetical protein